MREAPWCCSGIRQQCGVPALVPAPGKAVLRCAAGHNALCTAPTAASMHSSAGCMWRWVLLLCAWELSGSLLQAPFQCCLRCTCLSLQRNQQPFTLHFAGCLLVPDSIVCALQPPAGHDVFEWSIIQAFGIFAVSVSGHSSLPVLRNSMAKPQVSVSTWETIFISRTPFYLPACLPASQVLAPSKTLCGRCHPGTKAFTASRTRQGFR